ncbi:MULTISPECIES: class I SAM-dependent methyltransferase [Streptosporangium]|uniref:2-polyprenyl-3-methyl-5-hydroxy-6-metoxy-1, 4-benzoquinol methylase n=1 Tax=Streptosporangium brasiliense TaxID=47480 RepID=A0ABT9RL27_9ACTN|nr:class I SAM-dependent methyltransferase [Streptosporangium brasiliense]MDP9870001.1 2-polyprenyl-3-methyl-5-hydroxy-6-metoxy-1,4-benzoquinol methylase [Streptosporangium brasiliense]
MTVTDHRWNHNIHYHPLVLGAVPRGAKNALDIGCGEGMLARKLRRVVPDVVAVDLDEVSIDLARAHDDGADIDYVLADFLTHPFERDSFDLIVSVATLHHMDAAMGLERMRELLRPGGNLVIIGLARSRLPNDLPFELLGIAANRLHGLTKNHWEHPSPMASPPVTYATMKELAARILPGSRYRRHLLWRYSLTWTRPVG